MNDFHKLCSIGVMAYNEGLNIESQLRSLFKQKTHSCIVDEIIVVSSGSKDETDEIVKRFTEIDPRIRLIIQDARLGKAAAINLFLENARNKICVLVNGDSILNKDAIEFLVRPFVDLNVGMTGGYPVPINTLRNFTGYICCIMWELHHEISLRFPKLGELVAFRKDIVNGIPKETAVDEVSIESIVKGKGYKLVYIPESKVNIKIPYTVEDFIKQRRRIATGHIWAEKTLKYIPSTRNKWLTLELTLRHLSRNPREIFFIIGAIFLECLARILGLYDYYIKRKNPYIWG